MIRACTYFVTFLVIIAVIIPLLIFKISHYQGTVYTFKARPFNDTSYLSRFYQTKFRSVDKIYSYMFDLVRAYSFFCEAYKIGQTTKKGIYNGHPIYLLKISSGFPKPIVLIIGGVNANDWVSITSTLYIANQLLANCSKAGVLITTYDWHFIPILNPDGYSYSQSKPAAMYWIKNIARWSLDYVGVNLDYNFPVAWKRKFNFNEDTYPGVKAFSEIESRALRDYIYPIKKNIEISFIFKSPTIATPKQPAITFPWSFTIRRPYNWVLLEYLAVVGADAANKTTGTKYKVIQSGRQVSEQHGRIDDWLMKEAGIHIVLTVQTNFIAELTLETYDSITKMGAEAFAIVNASATVNCYIPPSYQKKHGKIRFNE